MLFLAYAHQIHTYILDHVSPKYRVRVDVKLSPKAADDPDEIQGSGVITLILKPSGKIVQRISMPNLALFKSQPGTTVAQGGKPPSQYDDSYSLIFQDFNFDGRPDLAICNGTNGSYGLPSYDVFLFSSAGSFVKSAALTKLASEHLGLFSVDTKTKRLVVFDKDGAAWHQTSYYAVKANRPALMEKVVQDDTGSEEVVTTSKMVDGRWKVGIKKGPLPGD